MVRAKAPPLQRHTVAGLPHLHTNRAKLRRIAACSPLCRLDWRQRGGFISQRKGHSVKFHLWFAAAVAASLACPLAAQAQGIPDGVAHGAYVGNNTAGPIGGIVGGVVGGVVGGFEGALGVHPTYASYTEGAPRVYRHRHGVRHSYRHVHHHNTNS
jgi:hypothetical protein